MRVQLRFERVYGTASQYGDKPRQSPSGCPILLEDYPLPGERVTISLGQPVEELYRTYQVARAGGFSLVKRNVLKEDMTEADEAAALQQAQAEPLTDDLTRWNWYITIVIERTIQVPDAQCIPGRWFSIDPGLALQTERDFLEYGAYQADFLVDHLAMHIHKSFFATRDVDDRVVFVAADGSPFRCPQFTVGSVTASAIVSMDLCRLGEIQATFSDLQREGQLALTPLSPAILLSLVDRATTSYFKGRVLEELVSKLFLTIPGLQVIERIKTETEEIDIGIFNEASEGFLASEGAVILAECKNWSGKCGRAELSLLEKKAENRRKRCTLGFLISWNGFTETIDKELLRSSRERSVIVPLTKSELKTAVADNDFFKVIESAWRKVIFT